MAYQFTKSKSRELQEWIIGQIREVLPDEIYPLTGACRAVEFSLRGFLRRRTPSRSQKPFAKNG